MKSHKICSGPALQLSNIWKESQLHTVLPPRGRLSYIITGCIRTLALTLVGRVAHVREAHAAGWRVDVYCVIEACTHEERTFAENGGFSRFVHNLSRALWADDFIQCDLWNGSITPAFDTPAFRAHHPKYPYTSHHPAFHQTHSWSMYHKFSLANTMMAMSGRTYSLVWRTRTDVVSTGVHLHSHNLGMYEYVVPPVYNFPTPWGGTLHTDMEALLSPKAARHYSAVLDAVPFLYARGVSLGAETLLSAHMAYGNFTPITEMRMNLYVCFLACALKRTHADACRQYQRCATPLAQLHEIPCNPHSFCHQSNRNRSYHDDVLTRLCGPLD